MKAQLLMTRDHPVVNAHQVNGQHILPGLAYIDLLYQVFRNQDVDASSLELRQLTIYEPVVVSENDVRLDIECVESLPGQWRIEVRGQGERGGRSVGELKRYCKAQMHRAVPRTFEDTIDLEEIARSATRSIDLHELYAGWRDLGVTHGEFMRPQGRLNITDAAIYVDCRLSAAALDSATRMLFHPALIDGSAVCGAGAQFLETRSPVTETNRPQLALPFYFEYFRASELLQRRCIARLRKDSFRQRNDLGYCTLEYFNEKGLKVAELHDLATKRVRDPSSLSLTDQGHASVPNRAAFRRLAESSQSFEAMPADATSFLRHLVAAWSGAVVEQVDPKQDFYELGLDSAGLMEMVQTLELRVGDALPPTLLFEYVTIEQLAEYLNRRFGNKFSPEQPIGPDSRESTQEALTSAGSSPGESSRRADATERPGAFGSVDEGARRYPRVGRPLDIAVVGMSGRFPKSATVEDLWRNLESGVDCITEIPANRWNHDEYFDARPETPGKTHCRWGGFVALSDSFDYDFFGCRSEQSRALLDAREKLLLEVIRDLTERSGYTQDLLAARCNGRVGLYIGQFFYPGALAYTSWTITTIADFLRVTGPGISVDSQSASAMTALHLACQGVASGDCDAAIVASAFLLSPEALIFSTTHKGLASSPDRRCFSARSDGLILSEGAAAVLLRPLADAQRDNDEILAVIKGTALNRGPGGPTESNPGGAREASRASPLARQSVHVEVVRHALRRADVPMRSISYVEAALSGHPLYDGLALSGLKRAVQSHAADDWSCTIGSVESNVGHGVAVSALTQLVKVIFQLRHRAFAPSIRAATELSDCGLDGSPFRIAHSRQNWNRPMVAEGEAVREYPRRALITSYGSGGTHGCAVVEEYDPSEPVSA